MLNTPKDERSILGLTSFHLHNTKDYAEIAVPIAFSKKSAQLLWAPQGELVFQNLKKSGSIAQFYHSQDGIINFQ